VKQRVRFSKQGKIRFLSHRDLARVWERTLRRAGVPVAYSEGFSPRPRLSFGLALSTGHESLGEYLDIDLAPGAGIEPEALPGLVAGSLPDGMVAQAAIPIEPGTDSLQQAVVSCSWRIQVRGPEPAELADRVAEVRSLEALPITVDRKGSPVEIDARPAILHLEAHEDELVADIATQPRSLRPAELVRALGSDWHEGLVLRTHQWTLVDGARCEPIPLRDGDRSATSTVHAQVRAS
jgi:radical SAM-linked protein